jgi:hypothetical protein
MSVTVHMEVNTMAKKKQVPNRTRCPRCGLLWPQLAGRYCFDCEHQVELPLCPREIDLAEDIDDQTE